MIIIAVILVLAVGAISAFPGLYLLLAIAILAIAAAYQHAKRCRRVKHRERWRP